VYSLLQLVSFIYCTSFQYLTVPTVDFVGSFDMVPYNVSYNIVSDRGSDEINYCFHGLYIGQP